MNTRHSGTLLIILIVFITTLLLLSAKSDGSLGSTNILLLGAQFLGIIGAVLFSLSFVLSSRARFVEYLFDGLGDAYKVHHITGAIGFIFLINHPFLLVLKAFINGSSTAMYLIPVGPVSYSYGIYAIYFLLTLIVLTLFIKLPYNIWKVTHTFMGASLFFALLHVLNIESDVSRNMVLGLWVEFFLLAGGVAFIYRLFLYKKVTGTYLYKVGHFSAVGEVFNLTLFPEGESIKSSVGQYAFLKVLNNKQVSKEEHPFSIVEINEMGGIVFSVKKIGDYTRTLGNLKSGDKVEIVGPFGIIHKKLDAHPEPVFVAGGIGITPFVATVEEALTSGKKVYLYYSVREPAEALYDERFKELAEKFSNFKYKLWISNTRGKIGAQNIQQDINDLSKKFFFVCGPKPMMDSLKKQLREKGVKSDDIYMEDFTLR